MNTYNNMSVQLSADCGHGSKHMQTSQDITWGNEGQFLIQNNIIHYANMLLVNTIEVLLRFKIVSVYFILFLLKRVFYFIFYLSVYFIYFFIKACIFFFIKVALSFTIH